MDSAMARSSFYPVSTAFLLLLLPLLSPASRACDRINCSMGYCVEGQDGGYRCVCLGGYEGENCDKPVMSLSRRSAEASPCDETPCKNGGTCIALPSGEAGSTDMHMIDMGESETECEMEGSCYMYTCDCTTWFSGPNCTQMLVFCPEDGSAGVVWEATQAGDTLAKPCHSVDTSLHGINVLRKCSLDGKWEEIDYTGCTIDSESSPFLLLWVVTEISNRKELENRVDLLQMLSLPNMTGVSTMVSQPQILTLYDPESTYRVFFTYKVEFNIDASIDEMSTFWNVLLTSRVNFTINNQTHLQLEGHGFFPSDVCRCMETESALRTLCTAVNDNDLTSACNCVMECQCEGPFYVGNGVECAVDSDGDGYPNTVLSSCTESDTATYCIEDLCPETYYQNNTAFPCDTEDLDPNFEGCPGGEDMWGFIWPNARRNEDVVVSCPDGQGTATRSCVDGEWEIAQVLECDSSGFVNALTEAEAVFDNDEKNLASRLNETARIMQEVLQLIQPKESSSHLPGDLNTTNVIISGVLALLEDRLSPESNVTNAPHQNIFEVFNTALHPNNVDGWMTLQNAKGGASKLLDSLERYGLYRSLIAADVESRKISQDENIVVGVIRYSNSSNASSVTFPESLDELQNTTYSNAITAQISIPSDLLLERKAEGAKTAPVAGTIARGMEIVLLPESLGVTWMVASQVISAQVAERRVESMTPISVNFTFDTVMNASEFRCAYWNFSDLVGNGEWAFDGVEMVNMTSSNGTTVVTCKSTHLTSFAVLVNVSGGVGDISKAELQALMAVSYIGCAISLTCLCFTILFFLTLRRELFSHVHYFIHLNLAIALFLAYLVFVLGIQLARESEGACIFVAALLQYLFLSAFCWMMCEGIMLYLMLVVVFSKLSEKWWFFLLLGWLPALVPVVIGLAARYRQYGVENGSGELQYCWLSTGKGVIWAFVAPMLAIITINVFFLIVALMKVFQTKRRQFESYKMKSTTTTNFVLFKTLFRATIVLLPILGLTWVFGLFVVNQHSSWLAWLFTILNTLQGCFIFIVHVVLSDKFWKNSRVKKLRGYMSTTVRSSHFGSTFSSTLKRSTTHGGSTLAKYRTNEASKSLTETTKIDDDGFIRGTEDVEATVIVNEERKDKELEAGLSTTAATAKAIESAEENTDE